MVFTELSPIQRGSTVFWGCKSWVTLAAPIPHPVLWYIFNSFQYLLHLQLSLSWFSVPWIWYVLAPGLALILSYYFHLLSTVQGISEQLLRQHCSWFIYMPWIFPFQFLFLNSPLSNLPWPSASICKSAGLKLNVHFPANTVQNHLSLRRMYKSE